MDEEQFYKAGAFNLTDIFANTHALWGIRIPNYQRDYKWKSSDQISRFRFGIYSNFCKLADQSTRKTFLGSIIFAEQEATQGHILVDIVDGQQRITTLSIFIVSLIKRISIEKEKIASYSELTPDEKEFLSEDIDSIIRYLEKFIFIQKDEARSIIVLPRLFRWFDKLGKNVRTSEFKSPVAKVVYTLSQLEPGEYKNYSFPAAVKDTPEGSLIYDVFNDFDDFLEKISVPEELQKLDYDFIPVDHFKRGPYKDLLLAPNQDNKIDAIINKAARADAIANTLRLIFFSSFLLKKCGFATVIATSAGAAFDIFEALNTTGVPLTAIETLKPEVIQYYDDTPGKEYQGSIAEEAFNRIDDIFNESFSETSLQEKETKVLTSAVTAYMKGKKVEGSLSSERTALRELQKEAIAKRHPDSVIATIKNILEYRQSFFRKEGISGLNQSQFSGLGSTDFSEIRLISYTFFSAQKRLVAAPLTRYYEHAKRSQNFSDFHKFAKALLAFTVLRRAVTGNTAGIDSIYRSLMSATSEDGAGVGSLFNDHNPLPNLNEVKRFLIKNLKSTTLAFDLTNKEEWVNWVAEMPLYKHGTTILKFLLLSSHHYTEQDEKSAGLITQEGITASSNRKFLTYDTWIQDHYETLEHVAPQNEASLGWDGVYSHPDIKHRIGNFTLVPSPHNTNLADATWVAKKHFFMALESNSSNVRENQLNAAEKAGIKITPKRKNELLGYESSEFLKGLSKVENWNKEFIDKRSKRLCELAWDNLIPWLKPDD